MATTIPGGEFLTGTLDVIAQSLLLPVMILLIIFIIFAIIEIGAILAEYTGRKKISGEDMMKLQTIFNNNKLAISECVRKSLEIIN